MKKTNKKFIVETKFIANVLENKLSLSEFLLIMYFDNEMDPVFNVSNIGAFTKLKEEEIMITFASLVEKKIIEVSLEKDSCGKMVETISLNKFYEEMDQTRKVKEKNKTTEDIYSIFEAEFGRTLSLMDYEVIKAWIEKNFSEELIIAALKEASYNGVTNLRYIDKILFDWNKKGIKDPADITNKKPKLNTLAETSLLNFDWLDNE